MNIINFRLAKVHQLESVADVTSCLNDIAARGASHKAETTQPNDDVYNLGTRRGRMLVDGALSGRSMVEMLGVLAIIGVLSVGAIAGYQKAMYKHKLNKQTEQISDFLGNSVTTASQFSPPPGEPGKATSYKLIPYYIKMGIVPTEMIDSSKSTTSIYDVFGNSIDVNYINWTYTTYIETSIWFSKTDYQQCMNVLTLIKELHSHIYLVFLHQLATGDTQTQLTGDPICNTKDYPGTCLKDLTIEGMDKFCKVCDLQWCRVAISYNKT